MFTKNNVTIGLEWRFGPSWPGQRCFAKTRRGSKCQRPANKRNGRCRLHGGASTGPRSEEGRKLISQANLRHGKYTKNKLEKQRENAAKGRVIRKELHQIEKGLVKEGVLASRLKRLTDIGLLSFKDDPAHSQRKIYCLSPAAIDLVPILLDMSVGR